MNLFNTLKSKLSDPLLTFKYFERFVAIFCILMPFILWLADGGINHPPRPSISDYVYMNHSYVFGLLLCIASMLFIFNGAVYYKSEPAFNISQHGQWYNVVLGISLIMVICLPYQSFTIPHFIFAGIFFLGNAVVTGIFYKDKDRKKSIALAILTVAAIPLAILNLISVLAAEWISLAVIGIHFILSTLGMEKPVSFNGPVKSLPDSP